MAAKSSFHKYLYQIYLYLALCPLLIFSTFHVGSIFWGTARNLAPKITVSGHEWSKLEDLYFFKKDMVREEERRLRDSLFEKALLGKKAEASSGVLLDLWREQIKWREKRKRETKARIEEIWADTDKKIEKGWLFERAMVLKREQLQGKKAGFKSFLWLLVLLPLLLLHIFLIWRSHKRK